MIRLIPLLLGGCLILPTTPCEDCDPAECIDLALVDEAGHPDGCDLSACVLCQDACGTDCVVLETYPPQYVCPYGSWDVYDVCPEWEPAHLVPHAVNVDNLGCGYDSGESLSVDVDADGVIGVQHTDFAVGCCPMDVLVDVTPTYRVLVVDYTVVDDFCDCACWLDVRYDIVDVPKGEWTIVAGPSGMTAHVIVP